MKITLTSIPVNNQEQALKFYTEMLGFKVKHDIPMGEHRWLTVVSPEGVEGVELVLEPLGFAPAADYQQALFNANIPVTSFESNNIEEEYARLKALGVNFRGEPNTMNDITMVMLDDTCGNLILLLQPKAQ